jgi:hypothetical protein
MIIESLKISEDHLCFYYKKIATSKISPTYDDGYMKKSYFSKLNIKARVIVV